MNPPTALEPRPAKPRAADSVNPQATPLPPINLDDASSASNRWWVWILVFAAIGFGCYKLYNFETSKRDAMTAIAKSNMPSQTISVVAAPARRGDMPVYLLGLGTVTAFNTVTVKTRVDGQLVSVNFREGQDVQKGQVLAEIDPRPYQVALDQAIGNFDEAKGTLAKDEAALKDAQVNYVRDKELFNQQIIARQQLDTQLATADQIRGSIEADHAAIAAAQAAIDNAKLNLTYTKIIAPIAGRIGLRQVDEGNMIHASDTTGLAIITQLQPIALLFNIPEDQLPPVLERLRKGIQMRTEAYDRDQTRRLAEGTLLTVDNQIDTTTGTSRLKAIFPNSDYALFPNQFVNIRLSLDTRRGVIIVPAVAIQRGPTGAFVYIVKDDSTVAVRPVRAGITSGNDVAIEEGLQPGDRVVVDGAEKLVDGMKVTLRSGAAARTARSPQE